MVCFGNVGSFYPNPPVPEKKDDSVYVVHSWVPFHTNPPVLEDWDESLYVVHYWVSFHLNPPVPGD
jgi:hypothetical protein